MRRGPELKKHHSEVSVLPGQHSKSTKAFPNSNFRYKYSWVSQTLFKAILFLPSYFPLTDLLSGGALLTSLQIRTLKPLISACDSVNEAKTIPWKGFDREKPVTSRDAFLGYRKEVPKMFFLQCLHHRIF